MDSEGENSAGVHVFSLGLERCRWFKKDICEMLE